MDMIQVQKNTDNDGIGPPSEQITRQIELIQSVDIDSLDSEQNSRIFEYLMEQVSL